MKKMLVIDGNSIINRAFYGVRPLTTSYGLHTNAVFGMINMLDRQITSLAPDYLAMAFDMKAPTFRHKMYPEYKAGRHAMPDELAEQFPYAKETAKALGFKLIECEGYEADDILGTLSTFGNESLMVYILTGDRDSLQLISDNVHVLLATNSDTVDFDITAFKEKYGILPSQYIDVKALMGDSSDNISGVRGIGEKTAFSLISEFGSLDGVYSSLETAKLTPSVKNKLSVGKDSAYLSKRLAEICRKAPIGLTLEDLKYKGTDRGALLKVFEKLEFSAFIKRFELENNSVDEIYADGDYDVRKNDMSLFDQNGTFSFNISADGSFFFFDGNSVYSFDRDNIELSRLSEFLFRDNNTIVCHDCKRIYKSLEKLGIHFRGCAFDTMLAAYVINSGESGFDLGRLVISYLGYSAGELTESCVSIYKLYPALLKKLSEDGLERLMYEIEMPLSSVLTDMELAGFKIDTKGIACYGYSLSLLEAEYERSIYDRAGKNFNINSPKQLGEVLFETLGLPGGKKTKTGYSTSAEVLEKMRAYAPIVDDILEYRKVSKLRSTYVEGLLREADANGRVHTTFKQTGTATGRLSSTEPNLQNIPVRTEIGRELRKYFIPENGDYVLIDADYSQIELRLLAHMSGDKTMVDAFRHGKDIHASTASTVFDVEPEAVTPEMRKKAKVVNFGILYGMGEFTLANDLHISRAEAKEYIRNYFNGFPSVDNYLKTVIKSAYENGYVTTMYGRRRYIPELKGQNKMLKSFGERVAMNSPIQGSAADMIKLAMINVHKKLREEGLDAHLILQVHDELLIESSKKDAERAKAILVKEMESIKELKIPLTVDVELGNNWLYE